MQKAFIVDVSIWRSSIANAKLRLDLSDGRTIIVPMKWYPRLEKATIKQQNNWKLIGKGEGIRWPDIDEDISLKNILEGKPSVECKLNTEWQYGLIQYGDHLRKEK